jgi:hypothetical protein
VSAARRISAIFLTLSLPSSDIDIQLPISSRVRPQPEHMYAELSAHSFLQGLSTIFSL